MNLSTTLHQSSVEDNSYSSPQIKPLMCNNSNWSRRSKKCANIGLGDVPVKIIAYIPNLHNNSVIIMHYFDRPVDSCLRSLSIAIFRVCILKGWPFVRFLFMEEGMRGIDNERRMSNFLNLWRVWGIGIILLICVGKK